MMYIQILIGLIILSYVVNTLNKQHNIDQKLINDIMDFYIINYNDYNNCIMFDVILDYCIVNKLNYDEIIPRLPFKFINSDVSYMEQDLMF